MRAATLEAWEPAGAPYHAFLFGLLRLEQGNSMAWWRSSIDSPSGCRIYPILAPHAGEYAVVAGVAGVLAPLTLTLGELCGTIGRYDDAVAYFERSIEECRRAGLRSDTVRTQLAWARVLVRRNARGDRRRAAALGREAQRRAGQLDSPLLVTDTTSFNATLIAPR